MIDRKNFILISTVLFAVFLIGFYIPYMQYQANPPVVPPAIDANGGPVTKVLYTNKGFEPETIIVPINTTVQWVNESDKLMWIGSDSHPSHTDLPGFDQRGIEGNSHTQNLLPVAHAHDVGGAYSYTFTKIGTWGYHNHLVPADRGTVVVQ